MMSTINTLVFDLGNTLYPSELQSHAMKKALEIHNLHQDYDKYQSFYKNSKSKYKFLGGGLNVEFIASFLENCIPDNDLDAYVFLGDYRQNLYNLITD